MPSTEIYTLSLHDALPIFIRELVGADRVEVEHVISEVLHVLGGRSEEHTSELQSRENLVCRLLLEKKKVVRDVKRIVDQFRAFVEHLARLEGQFDRPTIFL